MVLVGDPVWLTEADVVDLLDLPAAIDAVEAGLGMEADGGAHTMGKTHLAWGEGHTLHAIGAEMAGAGLVGTKTWAHTAGGATPLLMVWDAHSGELRAIIEAFALGQLRTGSMSGVATRWLAAPDAEELALLGTGKQALPQVAAVAAVRPIRTVRVWSPNPESRTAFIDRLDRADLGVKAVEAGTVAEAVADCPVVTTVTRAREPFLAAVDLAPGTHVNAVGAISPERRELDADVVPRCSVIAADSPDTARRLSTEVADAGEITSLSALIAEEAHRPAGADLTLFKAMGIGLADLALGAEVLRRAAGAGAGRPLPHPTKTMPRLTRRNDHG